MKNQQSQVSQNLKDSELINQFLQGNTTAFTKILTHHWTKLFWYNYSLLHNHTTAEDATLDEFMTLYETLKAGKSIPTPALKDGYACVQNTTFPIY